MKQITTKLPEHVVESLDHVAAEQYGNNRSKAIRELIIQALDDEPDEREQRLQERIEALEKENDRLHRERRQILEQRNENTELVRYAETERERRERERERRQHNVFKRAWWWVTGEPATEDTP